MTKCAFPGCEAPVTKPGHKLCYEHWKQGRDQPAPSGVPASGPVPAKPAAAPTPPSSATAPPSGPNTRAPQSNPKPSPPTASHEDKQLLSATAIGEKLGLASQRTNQIFAELGWISREKKGWVATAQGIAVGAVQKEAYQTGIPYVIWPESVTANKAFAATIKSLKGETEPPTVAPVAVSALPAPGSSASSPPEVGFREKFAATHRATDGHWVRSRAEMLIDNWLYMSGHVHAYERQLPIEEELYCDFYIPTGKVYIEYWGMESDPKYAARKKVKLDLYKKYNFNLIQLTDEHIRNLDDHLPKMLLKFDVISP